MVSALGSLHLWNNAWCIVGTQLGVSDTAGPRAYGVGGRFERDGLETSWVIRTDGRSNAVEERGARWTHAEGTLCSDEGGTEVERVALCSTDR